MPGLRHTYWEVLVLRFVSWLVIVCLVPTSAFADGEVPLLRAQIAAYLAKLEAKSAPYVVLLADDLVLSDGIQAGLREHHSIVATRFYQQGPPPGCLISMGLGAAALLSPFVYLGAHYAPMLTGVAGMAIPLAAALVYFRKEPYLAELPSDRHYAKVKQWLTRDREGLPKAWNPVSFVVFHEMIRARIVTRAVRLKESIRDRARLTWEPLSESEIRNFYIDYLNLWTLGAVYDLEARRYFDTLDRQRRFEMEEDLTRLLKAVSACQAALLNAVPARQSVWEGE